MKIDLSITQRKWWTYLEEDLQELILQAILLNKTARKWEGHLPQGRSEFHDYAFVVFPAAKAYEGFLKKFFLDLGFITQDDFFGKRFRVGKALNPQLEKRYRKESVYDKLKKYTKSDELPEKLWHTWKQSRNLLFHWFPNEKNAINLKEARERLQFIIEAIDLSFKTCNVGDLAPDNIEYI